MTNMTLPLRFAPFDDYLREHPEIKQHGKLFWHSHQYTPWKLSQFALRYNFLLRADENGSIVAWMPLGGSTIRRLFNLEYRSYEFELIFHHQSKTKKRKLFFRTCSASDCDEWVSEIENASKLRFRDVYIQNDAASCFEPLVFTNESSVHCSLATHRLSEKHRRLRNKFLVYAMDKGARGFKDCLLLRREVEIFRQCTQNLDITFGDMFETKHHLYVCFNLSTAFSWLHKLQSVVREEEIVIDGFLRQSVEQMGLYHRYPTHLNQIVIGYFSSFLYPLDIDALCGYCDNYR